MGALGFLGVEYDEKYGGAGADFLTSCVLHEEFGRSRSGSVAMAVGVHTDMASPHLCGTGSEALKEKYLPGICRGETLTAIAVTEPGGGSDVAAIRTRAVRDGGHYVLNGAKMFITNGALADIYFVGARVDAGAAGGRHRGSRCSWWSATPLAFRSAALSTRWACGPRTRRSSAFRTRACPRRTSWAARGWAFTRSCASSTGSAWWPGSTRSACPSAPSRTPWPSCGSTRASAGPLADKQVLRHRLADLATAIEAGRWLTYAVCLKYAAGEDVVSEISMVKLYTAEMAPGTYECVQMHGGYGYMREYPIERFARDVRLLTIGGGTSEIMREIIAKHLLP